jgi:hypothetical protein
VVKLSIGMVATEVVVTAAAVMLTCAVMLGASEVYATAVRLLEAEAREETSAADIVVADEALLVYVPVVVHRLQKVEVRVCLIVLMRTDLLPPTPLVRVKVTSSVTVVALDTVFVDVTLAIVAFAALEVNAAAVRLLDAEDDAEGCPYARALVTLAFRAEDEVSAATETELKAFLVPESPVVVVQAVQNVLVLVSVTVESV